MRCQRTTTDLTKWDKRGTCTVFKAIKVIKGSYGQELSIQACSEVPRILCTTKLEHHMLRQRNTIYMMESKKCKLHVCATSRVSKVLMNTNKLRQTDFVCVFYHIIIFQMPHHNKPTTAVPNKKILVINQGSLIYTFYCLLLCDCMTHFLLWRFSH